MRLTTRLKHSSNASRNNAVASNILVICGMVVVIFLTLQVLSVQNFANTESLQAKSLHKEIKVVPLLELTRSNRTFRCDPPLLPLHDRIVDPSEQAMLSNQTIPRQIHVAWIRGYAVPETRCMSRDYIEFTEIWKKQFPSYSFYFHDDYAVDTLFEEDRWPEFPQLSKVMKSCIKFGGAVKVDVWRALVLYTYGGFYSDIDLAPGPKMTPDLVEPDDNAFFLSDTWNRPTQGLQGMTKHHRIAYFTILEILNRVMALEDVSLVRPVFLTGPEALKTAYYRSLDGTDKGPDLFAGGLHLGRFGQRVRKVTFTNRTDYINTMDRREMVPLDDTQMVTRDQRIKIEFNAIHWKSDIRNNSHIPKDSCWGMLYRDDNPEYLEDPK